MDVKAGPAITTFLESLLNMQMTFDLSEIEALRQRWRQPNTALVTYTVCFMFCGQRFSHSDDGHVHATTPCCARALAQAHPIMLYIRLVSTSAGNVMCDHIVACV